MSAGALVLAVTTSAVGATAPGTVEHACRTRESSICQAVYYLTDDEGIAHWADWASAAIAIGIIVFVAFVAQRLSRRLIRHTVSGLQGDLVQRRLRSIRRRTPRAFLSTGENASFRRAQRAETIGALLRSASAVVVFVFAAFLIFDQLSLNLGPFVATASIATAALGFGAQNIVRDFLAGFFIVVEDQYGVGDVIDVGEASGLVESVSLRTTRLRDADGRVWHVPNGEIKRVGNMSQQWSRALLEFRIALGTDIPTVIAVIKHEADELWHDPAYADLVIEEPEVWGPEEVTAEGILLKLAVKTKPLEQWQISRTLRTRVKAALDREGIAIAVPQRAYVGNGGPVAGDPGVAE